jgi:hypothetical protein
MVYLLIRRVRHEGSDVLHASTDQEVLRAYMRAYQADWNLEICEVRDSGIERAIEESRAFEAETGFPQKPAHEIAAEWERDRLIREVDGRWYLADMTWEIVEMPLI